MTLISLLSTLTINALLIRALFVAADLNIPDILHQKPCSAQELAITTQTHPESLQRMMHFLILNDFFTLNNDQHYQNNETSQYLRSDHPQTVRPLILHEDPTRWNAIGNLGYSVANNSPSFDALYKTSYFSYTQENPILSQRFDEAMSIISAHENNIIAQQFLFSGIVADIGGGEGKLLKQIITHHPEVTQALVIDLPQVVESQISDIEKLEYKAGNFFEPLFIETDTIILKRIIHDWSDEKALIILQNIAQTMQLSTRLLIIDSVTDLSKNPTFMAGIDLLLLSIFGGKERTLQEWQILCNKAGLVIQNIHELTQEIHAIECYKA